MFVSKNSSISKKCLGFVYVISTLIVTFLIIYLESSTRETVTPKNLKYLSTFYSHRENELVDLHQFEYVIKNSMCSKVSRQELQAIVIVTSYAGDVETRSAIRRSFSSKLLAKFGIRRVFLLALIDEKKNYNQVSQNAIKDENNRFRDIVQGNFYEDYKNLTYKHLMGLSWVANHCAHAKYVIKMDHDIIFDYYKLNLLLKKLPRSDIFLAGYILTNMKPVREPANKWYVSEEEYQQTSYPDFLSGWLYITTPKTARLLCETSKTVPYFWIDDLYVTGLLVQKVNITLVRLNRFYTTHHEYIECCANKPEFACDFAIGPSNNDDKLLLKFQKYAEGCFYKSCKRRKEINSLRNTCIAKWKDEPFGKGRPVIDVVKLS